MTTADFKKFLYSWFSDKYGKEMEKKLDSIDWEGWLYGRGMPPVTPKFDMSLATPAYDLANRWAEAASKSSDPKDLDFKQSDLKGWFAGQICNSLTTLFRNSLSPIASFLVLQFPSLVHRVLTSGVFLESLDDLSHPISAEYIKHMDSLYTFSTSKNAEIISRFYIIAMKGRWDKIYPAVAEFLGNVGRMKYVRPGYRGLNEVDRELAVKTFREHEGFYHPICRAMVRKDLKLD